MFADLLKQLDELRKRTARFRRVALHLHSVDSHDWSTGKSDASRNAKSRFQGPQGLTAFADELKPHLDVVAVTDHMRCSFATELSRHVGSGGSFVVLPGIEVNFRGEAALGVTRIHLLCIYPEGTSSEICGRMFANQPHIPPDSGRTGNEDVTGISLNDFVARVHQNGGICIAAHVDGAQGVRAAFRQTAKDTLALFALDGEQPPRTDSPVISEQLKKYLLEADLDGVEIHKVSDAPHYRWEPSIDGRRRALPTVLRFDAHCVEHFARSDYVTHIKMTAVGFEGLRDALLFSETRIRFAANVPVAPCPKLLGLTIEGDARTFFQKVAVAFAENLNCIIGARGSGKSTLVEALRYVLGYNRSLAELQDLEAPIRKLQAANLAGTLIRLVYETADGNVRVLTATFDGKSDYVTKVFTDSGEHVDIADVEHSGMFPLRLFGWSEIELLGRDSARQREMLDRLVEELQRPLADREEKRAALKAHRADVDKYIAAVGAAYDQNNQEIRRYKEYKSDFDRQNTDEVRGLFAELDLVTGKLQVLDKVKASVEGLLKELSRNKSTSLRAAAEEYIAQSGSQPLNQWWLTEGILKLDLTAKATGVQASIEAAASNLRDLIALVDGLRKSVVDEKNAIEDKLRKQFAEDASMQKIADLRANAAKRLQRVTELRNAYLKAWNALLEALKQHSAIAAGIQTVQDQIAGIRARHNARVEARLNAFLPEGMKVSIRLDPGRDTAEFEKRLYEMYGARSNQIKKIRAAIKHNCSPVTFSAMVIESKLGTLVGKSVSEETLDGTFDASDQAELETRTRLYEDDENAQVQVLVESGKRLKEVLDTQQSRWEDHEAILLNEVPVNEKSPGQRSSAMLPLIALAEQTPLVIDQPEDNLDKKLIGDVLARVLADLKEKRQIIVATHDPNILVGGDAEQVVVLEAESDRRASVVNHGSIDNHDIVEAVIDLLEGGKEAFEARRKRYQDRTSSL